jgi:hypothetical protein
MDGSTLSVIIIPVVVVISLAAWLMLVYYADSHPRWRHGPATAADRPAPGPRSLPGTDAGKTRSAGPDRPPAEPAEDRPRAA